MEVLQTSALPLGDGADRLSAAPPSRTRGRGCGRWSGKRDSNPRLRPWQGRTLPLSYSRSQTFESSRTVRGPARRPTVGRLDKMRGRLRQIALVGKSPNLILYHCARQVWRAASTNGFGQGSSPPPCDGESFGLRCVRARHQPGRKASSNTVIRGVSPASTAATSKRQGHSCS